MDKFGFSLSRARVIDYDKNDRRIAEYIYEHEPSFRLCIECGACAATCTAGNFTEFSLREFNVLLKRGENDKVRARLKKCMFCGKCILACPRGVNTRNVIFLARQAFRIFDGNET
ncbi:MAG TPA: 4Fe-4S dicluster domain-containing protein [Bacteroidales bacterium]|nr:4Fe-4S dicluster domain-containing protein [Bacteroidales bacterium]HNR43016.1 4Fe-4S dicluster domain-containing protein [Bacteroidales bacterium]HPM18329.1 4Fe-4S dicluster domain-containing protein [Bacteroidales bacterium]HQG77849.1 4Fe-4S dicluster domain-containing protein [Bacteroidales bacterium]